MSNVINSAFHVIRTARAMPSRGLPRKPKLVETIDLGEGVRGQVYEIEGIIPSPFCSPWRHPISRWKLRHLRADIKHHIETTDAGLREHMAKLENEAFLRGTGAL